MAAQTPKLHLLLGASGWGKSRQIYTELLERAKAGHHSVLIVPEQFTSSTERELYQTLGDRYSAFVESYSFTSLAETILERYGGVTVRTLSEAGRAVLVRRAVKALGDQVSYYARQRRSALFCEKAAQTIEELKSAGIAPDQLAAYADVMHGGDPAKLREIALIYGTYEQLLQQTAMDPGDRQLRAAERLELEPEFFAGRAVYIDEFDTFNMPKRALLTAMLRAADVTVALCCDTLEDHDHGVGLFSGSKQVAAAQRRMAKSVGVAWDVKMPPQSRDLRHQHAPVLAELQCLLECSDHTPQCTADAADPALRYYAAATRQEEAKAVAAQVAALARGGMRYAEMAVVCRDADAYLPALRYEFRLQNIPLFCDEATTPEHTAPAQGVLAALELLRSGLNSRTALRLLKTGLAGPRKTKVGWVGPGESQQNALENYLYTWNLKAEDWHKPFAYSSAGYENRIDPEKDQTLQQAEAVRAFLDGQVERLRRAVPGRTATARAMAAAVYSFLVAIGAEETRAQLAAQCRKAGDVPRAEEVLREWNVVMGLLDESTRLLGEEPLPPEEYAELFTLLLRTTDLGHIPQSLDSVILTTAGRMRLPQVKACFVVGLAEGEFPQTPGDTGLLSHADRDALIEQKAELPDCFENRMLREGICFYKALVAASEQVRLSWPGAAFPGDTAPASAALLPILRRLNVPQAELRPEQLGATPMAALDLMGSLWGNAQAAGQRAAVHHALQTRHAVQPVPGFDAVMDAADPQPAAVQGPEALQTLDELLGQNLRLSPTRFERYINCPFSYFMQDILRAMPRKKAELAANISGTLTHWVLEQALRTRGAALPQMDHAEVAQMVEELVQQYVQENLPGTTVRTQYLLRRISRNLTDLLCFIGRDMQQSGFQPVAFELRIAEQDPDDPAAPCVAPVVLDVDDRHKVCVVGTVDRVDAMQDPAQPVTWLRVVDYKTGSKEFALRKVYEGLDCQMLLYLFALKQNGTGMFCQQGGEVGLAGVEYLMADVAPAGQTRAAAEQEAAQPRSYPLEGLILDDKAVYTAMDPEHTGQYLPFGFREVKPASAAKQQPGEEPTPEYRPSSTTSLADAAKMERIRTHLEDKLVEVAQDLYAGHIAAQPLRVGDAPCNFCAYRSVCRHRDGENERALSAGKDPFAAE